MSFYPIFLCLVSGETIYFRRIFHSRGSYEMRSVFVFPFLLSFCFHLLQIIRMIFYVVLEILSLNRLFAFEGCSVLFFQPGWKFLFFRFFRSLFYLFFRVFPTVKNFIRMNSEIHPYNWGKTIGCFP